MTGTAAGLRAVLRGPVTGPSSESHDPGNVFRSNHNPDPAASPDPLSPDPLSPDPVRS